jgi:hypothetical protein
LDLELSFDDLILVLLEAVGALDSLFGMKLGGRDRSIVTLPDGNDLESL